jgi:hypothetical protein
MNEIKFLHRRNRKYLDPPTRDHDRPIEIETSYGPHSGSASQNTHMEDDYLLWSIMDNFTSI